MWHATDSLSPRPMASRDRRPIGDLLRATCCCSLFAILCESLSPFLLFFRLLSTLSSCFALFVTPASRIIRPCRQTFRPTGLATRCTNDRLGTARLSCSDIRMHQGHGSGSITLRDKTATALRIRDALDFKRLSSIAS